MNVHKVAGFSYDNTGGNPAGVLITPSMLSNEQMQSIAKEVNYSETAFLVKQAQNAFRIRYFSPEMEIVFCGHATIASGEIIAKEFGEGEYILTLNDGTIGINIQQKDKGFITSIDSIATDTFEVNEKVQAAFIDLFNFSKEHLNDAFPIKKSYSGNYHLIMFVKDKVTLENMQYDFEKAKELCKEHKITTISILFQEDESLYHSRNAFAYGGVYEDPATGSAAVALAEYLRHTKIKQEGEIVIYQGFDMQVPSKLYAKYSSEEKSPITVYGESRIIKEENR